MKTLGKISVLALGAMVAFASCKKEESINSSSSTAGNSNRSMKVRMTDNPGNYQALDVELTSVSAFNSSTGEWVQLNGNAQTVSVLELTNGQEDEIAFKSDLDAGIYSKVKLKFSQNHQLTLNAQASGTLTTSIIDLGLNVGATSSTSSNINDSVIIDINQEISASSNATVLLDFNVAESVKEDTANADYFIDPVITYIQDEKTGVMGSIENDTRAALMFQSTANSNIRYSSFTNESGEFMLRGMVDGQYNLTIMVDEDEDSSLSSTYSGSTVVVVDGQITNMGEIQLQ